MLTDTLCRVELNPLGPVQRNVALVSGDVPAMVTFEMTQVSEPPVAFAPGGVVLDITLAVALFAQPVMVSSNTTL